MARSTITRPGRSLGVLATLLAVLFGLIGAGVVWSSATWTPLLALDLRGGTQIVLKPQLVDGVSGTINQTVVDQAVEIIRQRVNGSGVSEAEVTTSGSGAGTQIIVSLPGTPDKKTEALVTQAAQLRFRAVLAVGAGAPQPTPSGTGTSGGTGTAPPGASAPPSPSASPTATASAGPAATATATASAGPTSSGSGRAVPKAFLGATTSPTPTPTTTAGDAPSKTPNTGGTSEPAQKPTNASDPNWIDAKLAAQFEALNCSDPANLQGNGGADNAAKPLVACSREGTEKYILGPAEVVGTDVEGATFGLSQGPNGATGPDYEVNLNFTGAGGEKFAAVTTRLAALQAPRNRFGIVLDGLVVSAPSTNEAITTGDARISGDFDLESAQTLSDQLKYGALPLSFEVTTKAAISATLGSESLRGGLLAGLIGLVLVVVYSLFQYRALGLVTVASLVIAGVMTYGLVVFLGWRQGYRLSLPGVAGLIVAIGITADSFIVYFERIRDEVRDGRPLRTAVEVAWSRARRTIIASDAVSFLAAVVLYVLAAGAVRGFAFTLGLTTLVDLIVVFLFTHPTVALLARTKFFGGGHKLSGFDPVHLGRAVTYTGRGRVRTAAATKVEDPAEPESAFASAGAPAEAAEGGRMTIAERRAAAERAALSTADEPDGTDADTGTATSGRDA